ncbi:MAG: phosphoribosylformylglycinamidine cyclo-ligase [Chloroflexi bacterium]|nr:phosphoribosylformylglycinamidine cyclo-ligase [Chloroflexota bacterium]
MLYNFGRQKLEWKRILHPKNVQEWHQYLYRELRTQPGAALPPLESITANTQISFSLISRTVTATPSTPIRLCISNPPLSSISPVPSVPSDPSVPSVPSVSNLPPLSASVRSSASSPLYTGAGVDINAGNRAVELMRDAVRSTYGKEVLAGIGAFGGLFDAAALQTMRAPVLVASTDGVGTKVKLAAQACRFQSIGNDIVNHCINDILVQGARPLFFLDYLASSRLDPEMIAEIVHGIATACRQARCALLGGETAEMPGVYQPSEFDVAGTIIGVVERDAILPRADLRAGDMLIGLASSGPHTNGYSLIRNIFEDVPLDTVFPELNVPLADALLVPHRSYLPVLQRALPHVKALAHLTGGGFIENIPRVLPDNLGAIVHVGSWDVPPLFRLTQQRGDVPRDEMYRVFNMGIGMVAIVAPENVALVQSLIAEPTWVIGELVPGERNTFLDAD